MICSYENLRAYIFSSWLHLRDLSDQMKCCILLETFSFFLLKLIFFLLQLPDLRNTKQKARKLFRALVGVTGYYFRQLAYHTLLAALVAVSSHLLPTALIFLEAGGTIAAIAQLLHQPPLFLEAARCTAARFMSCHKTHPLSSGGFKTDLEQTTVYWLAPPYQEINPQDTKVNRANHWVR